MQAPGQTPPPMMPPGGAPYTPAPSSSQYAPYGQPPTYPPTVGATPDPGGNGPNAAPYNWTNPLQPPYAQAASPSAPLTPGQMTYQTPGYAGPASPSGQYAPTYQPMGAPAPQRRPRGRIIAVISAICIIAVLGAGAVFAYNIFAAHTENEAAKILPANTFTYSALDLVSLANNNHHVTLSDLLNSGSSNGRDVFQQIGLSFQSDIQPWLSRVVAVAAFQKDTRATTGINQPLGSVGGAFLVQSRDDGAAQSAMAKAANYLRNQGSTITNSTYSNVPLYSVQTGSGSGSPAVTFGAGKGWAIVAFDAQSAQMIIDRIDGKGSTLSSNTDFQNATSDLPSTRFGTFYVNLRALLNAVSPGSNANIPFINTYPIATGYTAWTDAGERTQITFKGSANIGNVAGDTKSLAGLVPASAVGYVGIANPAGLYQAGSLLAGTTSDPTQSQYGVSATDPALQQPAAFAYLGPSGGNSQVLFLHLTDTGTGQDLIQKLASAHSWTTQTTTIGGQTVTAFSDTNPGSFLGNDYGYDGSSGPYVAGYAAIVNSTLVVTGRDTAMQAVLQTAQGGSSLAHDSTFSQLASAAPSGAALTGYVNIAGIAPSGSSSVSGLASRMTAVLLTGAWSSSQLQLTLDTKMNG